MAIKKQLNSKRDELSEAANDWIRQFLKVLELNLLEEGQDLASDDVGHFGLATVRAVKRTLLDAGFTSEEIVNLIGRVELEGLEAVATFEWNSELNKRRFELIDKDIQGTLSRAEQIELAGLTQLMREQIDSDENLPLEGARKLHQLLSDIHST